MGSKCIVCAFKSVRRQKHISYSISVSTGAMGGGGGGKGGVHIQTKDKISLAYSGMSDWRNS